MIKRKGYFGSRCSKPFFLFLFLKVVERNSVDEMLLCILSLLKFTYIVLSGEFNWRNAFTGIHSKNAFHVLKSFVKFI